MPAHLAVRIEHLLCAGMGWRPPGGFLSGIRPSQGSGELWLDTHEEVRGCRERCGREVPERRGGCSVDARAQVEKCR